MKYKVIYGLKQKIFNTIEKARAFRDKKRKKYENISIIVTQEDVDPR